MVRTRNEITNEILRLIDLAANRKMEEADLRFTVKLLEKERLAIAALDNEKQQRTAAEKKRRKSVEQNRRMGKAGVRD